MLCVHTQSGGKAAAIRARFRRTKVRSIVFIQFQGGEKVGIHVDLGG